MNLLYIYPSQSYEKYVIIFENTDSLKTLVIHNVMEKCVHKIENDLL